MTDKSYHYCAHCSAKFEGPEMARILALEKRLCPACLTEDPKFVLVKYKRLKYAVALTKEERQLGLTIKDSMRTGLRRNPWKRMRRKLRNCGIDCNLPATPDRIKIVQEAISRHAARQPITA